VEELVGDIFSEHEEEVPPAHRGNPMVRALVRGEYGDP
jgi:hypothetical protein